VKRWPTWYPGKPLTAQDLIGLEEYLLSRSSIHHHGYGVVDFDYYSISVKQTTAASFSVVVSELRGITPSGQPVIVSAGVNSIECVTDISLADGVHVDLAVRVNPDFSRELPTGTDHRKLSLQCRRRAKPDRPAEESQLDLGGYVWNAKLGSPELWRRPEVYSLTALKPLDVAWRQWVTPLQSAIHDVSEELSKTSLSPLTMPGNRLAALTEISRLSVSFEYLPIEELAFRIKLLKALVASESRNEGSILDLSVKSSETRGDDLPASLGRLLRSAELDQITIGLRLREHEDFVLTQSADGAVFQFKRDLSPGIIELRLRGASGTNTLGVSRNESLSYHSPARATGGTIYRIPIPNGIFYDERFIIRPAPTETVSIELYLTSD